MKNKLIKKRRSWERSKVIGVCSLDTQMNEVKDVIANLREVCKKKKTGEDISSSKLAAIYYKRKESNLVEQLEEEKVAVKMYSVAKEKECSFAKEHEREGFVYLYQSKSLLKYIDLDTCSKVGLTKYTPPNADMQLEIQFLESLQKYPTYPLCAIRSITFKNSIDIITDWPKGKPLSEVKMTDKERSSIVAVIGTGLEQLYANGLWVFICLNAYICLESGTISVMLDFPKILNEVKSTTIATARKYNSEILLTIANV
jgi:hypothetical protein